MCLLDIAAVQCNFFPLRKTGIYIYSHGAAACLIRIFFLTEDFSPTPLHRSGVFFTSLGGAGVTTAHANDRGFASLANEDPNMRILTWTKETFRCMQSDLTISSSFKQATD
jgi:hypothetical protein